MAPSSGLYAHRILLCEKKDLRKRFFFYLRVAQEYLTQMVVWTDTDIKLFAFQI